MEGTGMSSSKGRGPNRPVNPRSFTEAYLQFAKKNFNVDHRPPETKHNKTDIKDSKPHITETKMKTRDMARRKDEFGLPPQVKASIQAEMNHRTWRHTAARPKERKQKVNRSKDMFVASLPPTSQESLPEFARIRFTEHRNSAINSRTRRIRIHDEMEPKNRPVFNGWNFPQLTSTGPRRSGPALLPVSQTHAVNLSTKKDNSATLNGRAHRSLSETTQNSEEVIEIEDHEEDDISTPVQRIGCFNKKFEYPIRKFVSRGHAADEVIEIEDLEEGKLFDEFVTNPRNIKQTPRLTKSETKELSHRGVLSLDQHTPQQQFLGSHRARRQVSKNTNPSKYREDYSKIESAEFNFYLTDEDDSVDESDEESESDGEDESESEVGSESGAKGKEDGDLVLTIEESDASDDTSDDDEMKLSDDGMCKPCITSTGTCQDRKHLCMGRGRARGRVKSRGRGSSINKPTVTRQSVGPAESVTSVTIKPISGPQTGVPDAIESADLDTPIISPPDPPTVSPVSLARGRGRGRGGGRGRGRGRGRGGCATIDTAPAPEPRATRSTRASNPRLLRSAGGDGDDRPSKPEDSTTPNIGDTGVHKQYAVHEEKHDMNDKAIKTEQNCVSSVDSSSSITAVPSHGDDSKELDIFKSVDLIPQGSCIPSALPQLAQADIEASLNCLITEDDEDINEPIAESVDLSDLRPESPLPPVPFDLPEKGVDQTRFPTINSGFTGIECTSAARVVSVTTSPVSQLCTDSSSRSRFPPSLDDTARRKKIRDLMQEKERLGTLLAAESAPRLLNSNLNVNTEAKAEVRKVTIKKITKKKKKESISSNETPCLLDSTLEDAVSRNSSVDVTGVAVEQRFDQPIQKPASTQSNLPPIINTTCTVKEGTTRKKKTKKDSSPPSDLTVLSPGEGWKVSPDCTVDESVLNAVAAGDLGKPRSPAPSAGFDKNGTWIGLPPPSPSSILPAPVNKQCQKQSQLQLQQSQRPHQQQLRPHPAAAHSQQQPNNIVSVHPSQFTARKFSGVPHQQQQLLHQYQEQHAIPQTTSSTIAQVERQLPTRQEQPVLPALGQIQPVQPTLDQVQPELPVHDQAQSSLPGQVPPSVIAPLTVTTSDLHGNPLHSNDSFTTGSASLTPGSTISSTQDLSELNKKKRRKRRKNELEQNKATQQEVEAMVQAIYARVGVPKHASPDDSQLMQAKDIQTETPIVLQKSVPVSTGVSPVAPNSQGGADDTLQTTVDAANQQSVRIVKPAADKVKKKRRKKKEAEGVTAAEMEPPLPVPNQEWVQEQLQIAQNQPLSDSLPPPMPASSAGNHPPPSEPARNMARSTQATSSTHTSTLATINRSMAMTDINQVLSSSTSLAMSHCSLHTSVADAAIVSRAGAALRRGPQIQPHQLNVHNPPTSTAASEIYAGTFPNQGNVTHSKPPGYENVFALQEPNKLSEKFDELFSSVLNSPILESVVENAAVSLNTTTTQTGLGQSYMQGYPSTNTILATASGNTSAMLPSVVQQQVSLNSGVSMQSFNSVRNSTISTTMPSVSGGYMQATKLGDSSVFTASSENAWNTKSSTVVAEIGSDSFKVDMDAPEMTGVFKSGPDADLVERLRRNQQEQIPSCNCLGDSYHYDESVEGPYYTHLGAGPDVPAVRRLMEQRLGISGKALRLEKVVFTNKEGRSPQGCPIAKWIIRRSGPEEKVLCVVRERPRHTCNTAVMVLGTVVWDGVPEPQANQLYDYLCNVLPENGHETERRCGTNDRKNCACQGWNGQTGGASFSFGCSWSMYYNGCKFARSAVPRKFRLKDDHHEPILESHLQRLATDLGPLYKNVAPDSFRNMTQFEDEASACRLGLQPGRPFSGVTAVVDYCAHAHKDIHNMNNGCTVVVTLTKPESRNVKRPLDEQLHVLPLCVLDPYDEFGSSQSQYQKIQEGAIDWLTKYPVTMRIRSTPLLSKAKRRRLAKLASCGRGGRGKLPKGGLTSLARAKGDGYPSHTNASLGRGRGSPRGKGVLRSPYSGAGGLGAQTAPRGVLTNPTRGGFTPHIPGSSPFWNPKNRAHPILNKSASVMSSPKMLSPKQRKLVFKLADGKKFRFGKNGSVIKVRRRIVNARQDYDQLEAMEIGGVKQAWEVMSNGSYDVSSSNQSQSVNQQVNAAAMAQRGGLPGGSTAYSEQRHGTPNALPGSNPPLPNQGPRLDLKSQNLAAYNRQQSDQVHSNQTHSNQYTQSGERAQYGDSQNNAQRQFSAQDPDEGTGNLQHWFDNFCDSMDVQPLGPDLSVENPSDMLTEELDKYAQPSRPNQNCLQGQRLLQNSNCQSQPVNNTHNNHSLGHSNVASMYSHGSQPFSSFPKRPVSNGQSYEHQQQQQPHQQQQQQRQQQQQQQQHYQQHVYKSPQAYPVRPGSHEGIVPTPFQTPSHPPSQRSGGWGQERPPSNHSHATPTAVVPDPATGQRTTHGGQQAAYHVQNNAQSQNSSVPVRAVGNMHQLQPNVANQHNNHHFDSPLDLLSEAAAMQVKTEQMANHWTDNQNPNGSWSQELTPQSTPTKDYSTSDTSPEKQPEPKPTEVKTNCEDNFKDNSIGGVAIALTHGSVLFECAKRELHATTALKTPNRVHPTRISLVFYQHKSLNATEHGTIDFVEKSEMWKQRREAKKAEELGVKIPEDMIKVEPKSPTSKVAAESSSVAKRGRGRPRKRPLVDKTETDTSAKHPTFAPYRYQLDANVRQAATGTTTTVSTKWIHPKLAISGPYQRWF